MILRSHQSQSKTFHCLHLNLKLQELQFPRTHCCLSYSGVPSGSQAQLSLQSGSHH